jgi:hypothetical protein
MARKDEEGFEGERKRETSRRGKRERGRTEGGKVIAHEKRNAGEGDS